MRRFRFFIFLVLLAAPLVLGGCATTGRQDTTLLKLLDAVERDRDNYEGHINLVRYYLEKYDRTRNISYFEQAAGELKEAIRLRPDVHWNHCTLAQIYIHQGKEDLALFEAKAAVETGPDCSTARKVLGTVYGKKAYAEDCCVDEEFLDLGLKELKAAVGLEPGDYSPHMVAAVLYSEKGMYEVAEFEAREAVRLQDSVAGRRALGFALSGRGDFEAAIAQFRAGRRLDPGSARLQGLLAFSYFVLRSFDDCLKEAEIYIKVAKGQKDAVTGATQYLSMVEIGHTDKARPALEAYAKDFEGKEPWESALLKYYLGTIGEEEVLAKGRNKCESALLHYFIGYNLFLKGDKARAREHFEKARDARAFGTLFPTYAEAMLARLAKE